MPDERATSQIEAANKAKADYRWEEAAEGYAEALALLAETGRDSATEYQTLSDREACFSYLGDLRGRQTALEKMVEIAAAAGGWRPALRRVVSLGRRRSPAGQRPRGCPSGGEGARVGAAGRRQAR